MNFKISHWAWLIMVLLPGYVFPQISASDSSGCAPLVNIVFNGPTGATGITWDFGDGTGSNLPTPVHNFVLPGVYPVNYSATVGGNPVNYSLPITVYGKPSPSFTATPPLSGCVPLSVLFLDSSTGGGGTSVISREWSFGDGGVNVGNSTAPNYAYTLPGIFTVTLKVIDANGCDSSFSRPSYISTSLPPNPVITTTPNPPAACFPPLNISFSGSASTSNSPSGGGLTYSWNFGGGNTSIVVNPPDINYTTNGVFPISLTVTDNNNCSATAVKNVVISGPNASFYAAGAVNDTVCPTVNFQNNSTGVNPWFSYGDGTFGADTFHTYTQPGIYQVTLQMYSGSCMDDTTITIIVEEVTANFTSSPTYSCSWPNTVQFTNLSTGGVSYNWLFGDSTTSNALNPVHTYLMADTNQYTIYYEHWVDSTYLEVTSAHGCKAKFGSADSVFKPTARFMPDKSRGCVPLTVVFSDSSVSKEPIINYNWSFGDGATNIGTNTTVTHTFTQPGIYYVRLIITNSAGCIDTSYLIPIYVGEPSSPNFSVTPNPVCVNTPVQFTDLTSAGDSAQYWHYNADGGIMSHCYTNGNPSWSFNSVTGPQSISLTTVYNGCEGSVTLPNIINVKGPLAHFIVTGDCATPFTYSFQGDIQDANYWTWDFGDGTVINNSTQTNISHTYTVTGDFTVILTAYNNTSGCVPYSDTAVVNVRNIQASISGDIKVCSKQNEVFTGINSQDAYGHCYEGYLWYWGDNKHPDNADHPDFGHIYNPGGNYTITLIVKDINGCTDTAQQSITAYDVKSYFKPDKLYGCMPLTINFTDSSFADTTITSWQWTFGDGGTSNLQNPSHTYTQPGVTSWQVMLVVTTSLGCRDTMIQTVFPSIPDPTFYIQSSNNICTGDSVKFIANSTNVTYNWNFGNGGVSNSYNPASIYNTSGFYNVSLQVTDSIGCTATMTLNNLVYVQDYPSAGFFSSADTLLNKCYPLLVSFTDTSIANVFGSRNWNLGNGTSTIGNVTVGTIYQAPGTYNITLIESTTNGCRDTVTKSITIQGPLGDFDILNDTICRGQSITFSIKDTSEVGGYLWDFGDGTTSPGISPVTHIFNISPSSGQTSVSLVLYSPDSVCTATVIKQVYIYPTVAGFTINGNDSVFCLNKPVQFTNTSLNATSSSWNFGDGTVFNGITPPAHSYTSPGVFQVILAVSNSTTGCNDTLVRELTLLMPPNASATGGDTCQGSPVQLLASGGISYQWNPSTDLTSDTIPNPIANPATSTQYSVIVTDQNGCMDTAFADVIIFQPVQDVHTDSVIVIGQTVQLDVYQGPGYTYAWSPAEGLSCTDCPNPIAQPLVNTVYSVVISDDAGCFSVTSTFNFDVKPITTIDVPTAFTPNGDGNNDVIYVNGLGIKRLIEFKIYNRWGQLLFETDDINKGWDGFYLGKLQNIETYVYFASVETWINGEILTKKGSFNLLR